MSTTIRVGQTYRDQFGAHWRIVRSVEPERYHPRRRYIGVSDDSRHYVPGTQTTFCPRGMQTGAHLPLVEGPTHLVLEV